jgi:hypothetical protein
MFHLLVAFRGWPDGAGSISSSRIYIRATDPVGQPFLKDDGKLDLAQVGRFPALLVSETGGTGPQFARVAHITNVLQTGNETTIEYVLDNAIPQISNDELEAFGGQLGLSRYTLTHTHWAIHDVDLFKVLLLNQQRKEIVPKVFSIEQMRQQERDLVSVMMPFSADFDGIYRTIEEAVVTTGLRCSRADNFWEHHAIIQDIVNLIVRARVVICDCSGRNPNVFYEAGIAHALGKDVIILTQSENDIPFDLRHLRYIRYLNNGEGQRTLADAISARLKTLISYVSVALGEAIDACSSVKTADY